MIAQIPATVSRTSRNTSGSVSENEAQAVPSSVRLVQIMLALYLIPVLVVMFLVGGIGIVVASLVVIAAKLVSWGHSALKSRENPFPS